MAASLEYEQNVKNEGIGKKIVLEKFDGYPMQIVQLETTIDKLEMRRGDYCYACTPHGLSCKHREAQGGLAYIG